MDTIVQIIARELGRSEAHVEAVVELLDEGNTVPFIARYRKELHGSMDDTALRALEARLAYLRSLEERRETVLQRAQGRVIHRAVQLLAVAGDKRDGIALVEQLDHGLDVRFAAPEFFRDALNNGLHIVSFL